MEKNLQPKRNHKSSISFQASTEYDTNARYGRDTRHYPKRKMESSRSPWGKKRYNEPDDIHTKSSLKVINLTDKSLTRPQMEVLSLGLTFAPASNFDRFFAVKDLYLFARKLFFKKLYQTRQP